MQLAQSLRYQTDAAAAPSIWRRCCYSNLGDAPLRSALGGSGVTSELALSSNVQGLALCPFKRRTLACSTIERVVSISLPRAPTNCVCSSPSLAAG